VACSFEQVNEHDVFHAMCGISWLAEQLLFSKESSALWGLLILPLNYYNNLGLNVFIVQFS